MRATSIFRTRVVPLSFGGGYDRPYFFCAGHDRLCAEARLLFFCLQSVRTRAAPSAICASYQKNQWASRAISTHSASDSEITIIAALWTSSRSCSSGLADAVAMWLKSS